MRATRHNHRDANEAHLLALAYQLGLDWVEAGPLDGLVWLGQWMPVEIKNPKGRNRLQPGQRAFITLCVAQGRPYAVWREENDVIHAANLRAIA